MRWKHLFSNVARASCPLLPLAGWLVICLWLASDATAEVIRIAEGRKLFMDPCYRCHPMTEEEKDKLAPRIKSMDVFGFAAAVWNQSPNMLKAYESKGWKPPAINALQMKEIFLFTQILADREIKGNPERGKTFVIANRCLTCHSIRGQGGQIGVPWDRFANVVHPTALMSAVWSHRRTMILTFRQRNVPLPTFRSGDLADLIAFLRQEGQSPGVSPILVDLEKIAIEPDVFDRFQCNSCHNSTQFVGHPELSLQDITEALLTHAFMPSFERPPLDRLDMTSEDSLSLAGLVYYLSRLGQSGDASKGKALFRQHGCTQCHALPDKKGDQGIGIQPIRDDWDLVSRIFNKVPKMIQTAFMESRAFPRLTPDEMSHLYAYLCASSSDCSSRTRVQGG